MKKVLFLVIILFLLTGCSDHSVDFNFRNDKPEIITVCDSYDIIFDLGKNFNRITFDNGKAATFAHKDIMIDGLGLGNPEIQLRYSDAVRVKKDSYTKREVLMGEDGFNDWYYVNINLNWDLEKLPEEMSLPEGFKGHMLVGSIPKSGTVMEYRLVFYKEGTQGQFELVYGDDTDRFMSDVYRVLSTMQIVEKGAQKYINNKGVIYEKE